VEPVTPPSVPFEAWILAAFDPVIIAVAAYLGWKADQFAKVFIAAIAALAASMLIGWLVTSLGLPWPAPVGRAHPTLMPVRTIAALVWASLAFGVRRLKAR
jgi:biotin transporter BioY